MVAYDIPGTYPVISFPVIYNKLYWKDEKKEKKRPEMAYFVALRFIRRYNMHVAHLGIQEKKRN